MKIDGIVGFRHEKAFVGEKEKKFIIMMNFVQ
jgi:hypothetical protein